MPPRRKHRVLTATIVAVMTASIGTTAAWAATIGGLTNSTLSAWQMPAGLVAPTVVSWSGFPFRNNTNLDGAALEGGGTWIAQFGTWKATSNAATSNKAAYSNLTTDVGTVNAAVVATIDLTGNSSSGLVAMSNGASFVFAEYDKSSGGQIRLFKYVSGAVTQLALVTGLGKPALGVMQLDATTNTVKVSWNGAVVLSYALTAVELVTFKSPTYTRFGLLANNDPAARFDDIHFDTIP